jgi:hypothetical protein
MVASATPLQGLFHHAQNGMVNFKQLQKVPISIPPFTGTYSGNERTVGAVSGRHQTLSVHASFNICLMRHAKDGGTLKGKQYVFVVKLI